MMDDLTPAIWRPCDLCGAPAVDYRLCGACASSLMADDEADPPGNLCPECNGCGLDWDNIERDMETGEYLDPAYECPACDGTGLLTEVAA